MAFKVRLAVLGSTNGTDMQAIIDAIASGKLNAEIVMVASDKKDAFILERASKYGIPTFWINYLQFNSRGAAEIALVSKLKEKKVDLILLIGFAKIVTPVLIDDFRGRIWNIHPSLLPKYAGGFRLAVHKQVLDAGEKETGCTLHEVTADVDQGKILMQKKCEVVPGETPETLKVKVQKLEQECLLEGISMVSDGLMTLG